MKRCYIKVTQRFRVDYESRKDLREIMKELRRGDATGVSSFSFGQSYQCYEPVGKASLEIEENEHEKS